MQKPLSSLLPGIFLAGGVDCVVAFPREMETEVIQAALGKVRGEIMVAIKIREGMPARELWDSYGVMQRVTEHSLSFILTNRS